MTYRQCPSCGGECKKSGCQRADVIETYPENFIDALRFDTAIENDYERGFIDGMAKQTQSSVDKAVNAMSQRKEWVGLTDDEYIQLLNKAEKSAPKTGSVSRNLWYHIEAKLKEKNT
jgi:hypothetical protein